VGTIWQILSEAGTCTQNNNLTNTNSSRVTVDIPPDAAGKSFHVICEVTDDGTPNRTGYRRIIFQETH